MLKNSPRLMSPRKMSHSMRKSIAERSRFIMVPCRKASLRTVFTFSSSSRRTASFTWFKRSVSCRSSPRLLTSSTLRRVSVVEPASSAVWATMRRWAAFIRRLTRRVVVPSTGMMRKYARPIHQCTQKA